MISWITTITRIFQNLPVKKTVLALVMVSTLIGSFATPFVHQAQAQAGAEVADDTPPPNEDSLPLCWIGITSGGISMSGCMVQVTYYVFYIPTAWLLSAAGGLFDTLLAISIDERYIDTDFANEGWAIARDVVNIVFIFILLYISIATILQVGGFNLRELVVRVVIIALLVNFSLFFTKVVIDSSNILALAFYNNITATEPAAVGDSNYAQSTVAQKNISISLISAFKPQQLLGEDSYRAWADDKSSGNMGLVVIFLAGATINLVMAWILFVVGLLFLLRIISLWFLMVGAPVAFFAWILPVTRGQASKWWNFLLRQSFLAPIFLFFLFLITQFVARANIMDAAFTPTGEFTDADMSEIIISILLKMIIIVAVLWKAMDITKNLSSSVANGIVGRVTGVAKFAGGLAAGGVAGLGRLAGARMMAQQRAANAARGEGLLKSQGRVATAFRQIPGVAGVAGRMGAAGRKDVQERQAKFKGLSDAAVRAQTTGAFASTQTKQAGVRELAARKKLTPDAEGALAVLTPEFIRKQAASVKALGSAKGDDDKAVTDIEKQAWQYASTKEERIASASAIPADAIADLKHEDYSDPDVLKAMMQGADKKKMEALIDRGPEKYSKDDEEVKSGEKKEGDIKMKNGREDSLAQAYFDQLKTVIETRPDPDDSTKTIEVEVKLETTAQVKDHYARSGDARLANWAGSMDGKNTLETYGFDRSKGKEDKGEEKSAEKPSEAGPQIIDPSTGQPFVKKETKKEDKKGGEDEAGPQIIV